MSSDLPNADPSSPAEPGLAALLRERGAPLLEALERHLPGAREHADGTASYAFVGAVAIGFDRTQCEVAREAARLHEIGLVYVPAEILNRPPSARDEAEEAAVDSHFEAGYRLARGAGLPETACGWLLRARERFDGRGPEGLGGGSIPIESRLISAACVCQTTLSTPGLPGEPSAPDRARAELSRQAAAQLDPSIAAALLGVLERAAQT
jgi:HD-GYP domain-containing protein (c-di-GMP phosphodiesterase class II)